MVNPNPEKMKTFARESRRHTDVLKHQRNTKKIKLLWFYQRSGSNQNS